MTACVIISPLHRAGFPVHLRRGGIAQLARAIGSYPIGRGLKSNFRYQYSPACIRPDGQAVKTPPFHGSNGGSIPPRVSPQENFYGPMVKRLRHRPFTAVTGVRFPLGSFEKDRLVRSFSYSGGIERAGLRKQSGGLFPPALTEPAGETDSPSGHFKRDWQAPVSLFFRKNQTCSISRSGPVTFISSDSRKTFANPLTNPASCGIIFLLKAVFRKGDVP